MTNLINEVGVGEKEWDRHRDRESERQIDGQKEGVEAEIGKEKEGIESEREWVRRGASWLRKKERKKAGLKYQEEEEEEEEEDNEGESQKREKTMKK